MSLKNDVELSEEFAKQQQHTKQAHRRGEIEQDMLNPEYRKHPRINREGIFLDIFFFASYP